MSWYQSKPHIWRNFLVFVAISQIWQENFSKYVVWLGTKTYIWRSYYLTIWRILRKLYIWIYIFSCVCSNIANLAHRNSPILAQIIYLTIWRVLRKSYIRIYRYMPWYHSQPHIWRYILVFVCDISNLAHKNSPKLAQINRLSAILLSGEFQENRIVGSEEN